MNFEDLLHLAKLGDTFAIEQILEMYKPLLIKNSLVNGRFDEDLYMELICVLLRCIKRYQKQM